MALRICQDLAATWTAANPVLESDQYGVETDTGKIKKGNGTLGWTALSYVPSTTLVYFSKFKKDWRKSYFSEAQYAKVSTNSGVTWTETEDIEGNAKTLNNTQISSITSSAVAYSQYAGVSGTLYDVDYNRIIFTNGFASSITPPTTVGKFSEDSSVYFDIVDNLVNTEGGTPNYPLYNFDVSFDLDLYNSASFNYTGTVFTARPSNDDNDGYVKLRVFASGTFSLFLQIKGVNSTSSIYLLNAVPIGTDGSLHSIRITSENIDGDHVLTSYIDGVEVSTTSSTIPLFTLDEITHWSFGSDTNLDGSLKQSGFHGYMRNILVQATIGENTIDMIDCPEIHDAESYSGTVLGTITEGRFYI